MKIKDVLRDDFQLTGDPGREISGITCDSRKVRGGEIFVAVKGGKFDGNDFIEDAIRRGAAAVVYEKDREPDDLLLLTRHSSLMSKYPDVVWIGVGDARDAMAALANVLYGNPSERLGVIGITGTNGKTTTSYIIKSVFEKWGRAAGLIGTISYLIKDTACEALHTTPESSDFQALLCEMAGRGCDFVVSEVSSHALSQKRVEYTKFRAGVFTNLTRDHLDFHGTMENYYLAKERLFTGLLAGGGAAVVNIDDPYGERLAHTLRDRRPDVRVLTFGIENRNAGVTAVDIRTAFKGTSFKIKVRSSEFEVMEEEISSPLVGKTNVYNVLSAVCTAVSFAIPMDVIKEGIAMTGLVKGRFEKVDLGQDFLAVVDYAHTEDALERLLGTARQLLEAYHFAEKTDRMMKAKRKQFASPEKSERGKVITVIGCGGNRDKGKRLKMGEIAAKLSDFVIVTSDNPRYEDPKAIIREIEKGIRSDNYIVIPDRSVAISMAVELASTGDIVLVAGKGHEDYQEIQGVRHHFSDRETLESAIKRTTGRPAFGGTTTLAGMYSSGPDKN